MRFATYTGPWAPLLVLVFLILAAHEQVAYGQAGLEVSTVNTETGEPVPGVVVRVSNEAIGFESERRTNQQGKVQWAGLSTSGRYDIIAEETDAYYEAQSTGVGLRSNFTRSITLLLTPLTQVELDEVVVEARTGLSEVNRVNAEVSSSISAQALEDIPVEGRNFTRALYRLPNVTQATGFFPEAPNVSINGANGLFANYLIDGMDNNENFLGGPQFEVPTGFVKDITVLTSTYSAEYGRTGNGIFNVTTKSGSNAIEGEVFYLTRPGPVLDGDSPFAQRDLSGNAVRNGFQRHQGGFALGGPIAKDRTFYYVNVEHTTDLKDNTLRVPELGLSETIEGQNHFTYGAAKIDHRWNDTWRSSLRTNYSRVRIDRQGGDLFGAGRTFGSAGDTQQRDGLHLALQNTYAGSSFVYEGNVQYSRFDWNYSDAVNPSSPQVVIQSPEGGTAAVIGNPGFTFDSTENTVQVQQKVTKQLGSHTLKAGADVLMADFNLRGGGNPNGNYVVRLSDPQFEALQARDPSPGLRPADLNALPGTIEVTNYAVELRPSAFGTRQDLVGVYVEDQFTATSRLNVTAGLRWDYDSLSKGGADSGDWNNLAPRLSLNYTLTERSSLRGGYGIFYDKIVYAVYSDAIQQNSTAEGFKTQIQELVNLGLLPDDTDLDRVTRDGNLTANADDVPYLGGPTPADLQGQRASIVSNERRILNPNGYDNPYTHQFSLGYQRQLGTDKLFYVDLIHTRSYNQFRLRDLNAPDPYDVTAEDLENVLETGGDPQILVRTEEEANATRPVPLLPGGARSIIVTETAGEARYWAANVNLIKERSASDFSYRLSYTLSNLRNNTDDINFRAEDANDFSDEWGPSINDRRHVFSGVLSYYPPISGLVVTGTTLIQSGQPINRVPDASVFGGTRDLNGDGRSFGDAYVGNSDRYPGESRNSDRLPWSTTFDVSLRYGVPVGAGRVVATADVFNIFNAENFSGYSNNATQSNQIQVGPASSGVINQKNAGPPRQFQFGLQYQF